MDLRDGRLFLSSQRLAAVLSVAWWDGEWQQLAMGVDGDRFVGGAEGVKVSLSFEELPDGWHYRLEATSRRPTRVLVRLELPGEPDAWHLVPACFFGDNNLHGAEPGHFPHLTREHAGNVSCSPVWELRADRAALPMAMMAGEHGVAAISVNPYSEGDWASTTSAEGFVRNGVLVELGEGASGASCGVTLGYRNAPVTFVNKDKWGLPTEHLVTRGAIEGRILLVPGLGRAGAHRAVRAVYEELHEAPEAPLDGRGTAEALTRAFLHVNWHSVADNFTNMMARDWQQPYLQAWRTLPEVGWTGGGVIGYPLLAAGHLLNDPLAVERGLYMLDWVAEATNPDSGLLWDVCGKREGKRVNWWWSGYLVKDVHCAYTNGSGLYYLLKAYEWERQVRGKTHEKWLATALGALATFVKLQLPSGSFGYTYRTDRPEIADPDGYAGVWLVPALVLAYRQTSDRQWLTAAEKGIAFYHEGIRALCCCGTPMDTWKSPEQEGNLGFIRGAQLLHEVSGDPRYLAMLEDAADYEYLWRFGFRARPQFKPLAGSPWTSVGGSITSVSNPHIHPMGVFISRELGFLARQTGDDYHRRRWRDGLDWGRNIVSLYPDVVGYGVPGVLTERWCPSDGLTIDRNPDGSYSSIWYSYNGWSAAAVLEAWAEELLAPHEEERA